MYLEFRLPNGAGGQAAAHYYHRIKRMGQELANKHSSEYKIWHYHRDHSNYAALSFSKEELYTLWILANSEFKLAATVRQD